MTARGAPIQMAAAQYYGRMDQEAGQRFLNQILDTYINPDIRQRQELGLLEKGAPISIAQVLFETGGARVRLNDEVRAVFQVAPEPDKPAVLGEIVPASQVGEIVDIKLTDEDPDAAHITIVRHRGQWVLAMDLRYNASKVRKFASTAREFLDASRDALKRGQLHPFVENTFAATELMVRAEFAVLPDEGLLNPKARDRHGFYRAQYNRWGHLGNTDRRFVELHNRLYDIRYAARYADRPLALTEADAAAIHGDAEAMYERVVAMTPERVSVASRDGESASDEDPDQEQAQAAKVGLDRFVERLLDAGGHAMERMYPTFAQELQAAAERADRAAALNSIEVPSGTERSFSTFRTLLTLAFDLDVTIDQLAHALRLLGTPPQEGLLRLLNLSRGQWWLYHYHMWSASLWGVLDRMRALIPTALRLLRRPYDPQGWQSAQEPLSTVIDHLHHRAGEVRHPLAHGATRRGGLIDGIAEADLWEQLSVLRLWVPARFSLDPLVEGHDRYHAQARTATELALAHVVRVLELLTDSIDWEKVKQAVGTTPIAPTESMQGDVPISADADLDTLRGSPPASLDGAAAPNQH